MEKKYKLAVVASHPIQYQAPLFKMMADHSQIDLTVYFGWNTLRSKRGGYYDEGFGKILKWDTPLLEGYKHEFLRNYNPKPSSGFWGQINPGIILKLRKEHYDAVVVPGYISLTNWLVFLTRWFHKTPIIFRGEADLNKKISKVKKFVKSIVLRPLFKSIDVFLYSYSLNKQFFQFYGVPDKKLFFYPCAVDNNFFIEKLKALKPKRTELKTKFGIKREAIVIITAGKLIPRKRPLDLLKAFELLTTHNSHLRQGSGGQAHLTAHLIFVGDGPLRRKLEEYVEKHDLENVVFAGFKNQTEISDIYSIADVFVLASEFDPSPKALNEIMNFGVPVVVTNGVGTGEDLVASENCGFIYNIGDVDTLVSYLEKLVKDEKLRERLGSNTVAVVAEWSFDRDIEGLIKALRFIQK